MAELQKGVRFDPTINLGHILTFVGFILSGFLAFQHLDKRVAVLEEERKTQDLIHDYQDKKILDLNQSIQQSLHEIKKSIEKLDNKIEYVRGGPKP